MKGVAAPAGTPKEIVKYIEDTIKKICNDAEFQQTMKNIDQPIMYQNSAEFTKFIKQATEDYAKLIKELNIKID